MEKAELKYLKLEDTIQSSPNHHNTAFDISNHSTLGNQGKFHVCLTVGPNVASPSPRIRPLRAGSLSNSPSYL